MSLPISNNGRNFPNSHVVLPTGETVSLIPDGPETITGTNPDGSQSGLVFVNDYGKGVTLQYRGAIIQAEHELQSLFGDKHVELSLDFGWSNLPTTEAAVNLTAS
jgi:hypothetical protein